MHNVVSSRRIGNLTFGPEVILDFDISKPSAWTQHVPFMSWLIGALKPKLFVELGTHWGTSFLAACRSAEVSEVNMRAVAVDLWEGDPQAGFYGDEVFESVSMRAASYRFAELLQTEFDAARDRFDIDTIDLLHIDGLHTYDAVKHDFELWAPTLSRRGVIIFHDIAEFRDDFGVYRLWDEVRVKYPHFHFDHGHGLGVLLVGSEPDPVLLELTRMETLDTGDVLRDFFSSLGAQLDVQRLQAECDEANALLHKKTVESISATDTSRHLEDQLNWVLSSNSWKITKPLRALRRGRLDRDALS